MNLLKENVAHKNSEQNEPLAIGVQDVSAIIGRFFLTNISFKVPRGTVCGLVGKNSAGKTVLLRTLVNQMKKKKGTISIAGWDVHEQFEQMKSEIGVVWSELHVPVRMTARKLNKLYRSVYDNWDEDYFYSFLREFNVPIDDKVKTLSKGTLMKLNIALAMSHHPRVLILDEPTSGIDPFDRDEIISVFARYMEDENNTMIISSHIISDLEKIADSILYMEDGQILFHKQKDAIFSDYVVWQGFVDEMKELHNFAIVSELPSAFGRKVLLDKQKLLKTGAFERYRGLEAPTLEEFLLFLQEREVHSELE